MPPPPRDVAASESTRYVTLLYMEQEQFWALIEQARTDVEGELGEDGKVLAAALTKRLTKLASLEIIAFAEQFERLLDDADRWDLWGAAYLIGGGCSDDAFVDFRSGLIAAGREWYDRALADPDSLAAHPAVAEAAEWDDDSAIFAELVGYAADDAYQQVTGDKLELLTESAVSVGEQWAFDDDDEMRRRLPRLSALFIGWPANEGCRC